MAFDGSLGRVERIGRARIRRTPLSEKAPIKHLDPTLMLTALLLTGFGNLMVYSASRSRLMDEGLPPTTLVKRQLAFTVLGFVGMVIMATFSYRRLKAWGPVAYVAGLGLLLLVLSPLGSAAKGAQRWVNIGFLQLQPSEVMKIAVIVALALLFSNAKGHASLGTAMKAIVITGLPALLIYRQPDLGTLLVLIALLFAALVVGGTRAGVLLVISALAVASVFLALNLPGVLKDYQRARITAFLDPSADTTRSGYNLNQARIGVGSGELFGKGLFSGSQTNLDFVPEVHTDFIFVAVAEELGFVGAVFLLALFAVFLWRGIRIAVLSKDLFGTLLASGVVAMTAFQMFVNIGMTIGVSPITGIPLPFVSYGGSSLITMFAATGILLNVHMRRM